MATPPWPNGEMPSPASPPFGSWLSASMRARCSGVWTRRISSSVAGAWATRTRWSIEPADDDELVEPALRLGVLEVDERLQTGGRIGGNSPAYDDVSCQPKTSWYT